MNNINFSVVIPLYNKIKYIKETIDSVLKQTLPADEIIVVNDGCTDGGDKLVRQTFPYIKMIEQPNTGVAAARNLGLKESKNEWVALLDADDLWSKNHLLELSGIILEHSDARLVSSSWIEATSPEINLDENENLLSNRRIVDFFAASTERDVVCSSAVALHRETALKLGGFRHYKTGEDSDLWARLALHYPVAISDKVTAVYRRVPNSTMAIFGTVRQFREKKNDYPKGYEDLEKELKVISDAITSGEHKVSTKILKKYLDALLFRKARQLLVRGDTKRVRAYLSLVRNKRIMKYRVLMTLTVLPDYVVWTMFKIRRIIKK